MTAVGLRPWHLPRRGALGAPPKGAVSTWTLPLCKTSESQNEAWRVETENRANLSGTILAWVWRLPVSPVTLGGVETVVVSALAVLFGAMIGHFWPQRRASVPAEDTAQPLDALSAAISVLDERVETIERSEATRQAMTTDALDKFTRLYKRMAERQSREDRSESTPEPEMNPEYLRRLKVR